MAGGGFDIGDWCWHTRQATPCRVVERLTLCLNPGQAVAAEDVGKLASRRFQAGDQPLELLVLAQLRGDRGERALQIVVHRQDVAGEVGRGIGARIGGVLLGAATHVLRFGAGVEHLLLRGGELLLQRGDTALRLVVPRPPPSNRAAHWEENVARMATHYQRALIGDESLTPTNAAGLTFPFGLPRSEEHTSELQSH